MSNLLMLFNLYAEAAGGADHALLATSVQSASNVTAPTAADIASETVTLSGESVSHNVANGGGNTARAGIRVNTDGTMDKLEGVTFTQIDAATDWVIPNAFAGTYHVKFTKGFLDPTPTYNPDSVTLDTWYAISSTSYRLGYEETTNDSQDAGTITVHISDDAGSTTLDTGAYPLTATKGTPA